MNNECMIRALEGSDAGAFKELRLFALQESPQSFSQSYKNFLSESIEAIEQRIAAQEGSKIFGAFQEGQLIGCIGVHRMPWLKGQHRAEIWGMYVHPAQRSKKIGSRLVDAAIDFATATGIGQLELGVITSNQEAIALYKSRNFHIIGTIPNALQVNDIFYDEFMMIHLLNSTV